MNCYTLFQVELPLKKTTPAGSERFQGHIIIHAEKLTNYYDEVVLRMEGSSLLNADRFGTSDPYIEIYKHSASNDEYVLVHRTEVKPPMHLPTCISVQHVLT